MNDVPRILIVEDHIPDFELAHREIRNRLEDCVVQRVETRKEYLKALESFEPDLILSDYSLPGFDGMKALKLAQERAPFTPLIIWTGSINEDTAVDCMRAGATNYILKENIKRLAPAVVHALEERRLFMEHKRVEDELRVSEAYFRSFVNYACDAFFLHDEKGVILDVNHQACESLGYTREELIGMGPFDFDADAAPSFVKQIGIQLDARGLVTFDTHHRRKDRTVFPVEVRIRAFEENGHRFGIALVRDITDRKQAEAKLQASESRYRLATQATKDVIWEWDPETNQLTWNENAQLVFGYSPEEIGPNAIWWDEHIHPEDRERVTSKLNTLTARVGGESVWSDEYRFLLKNGSYAYINDHAYIERDPTGKTIRMIGAMSNITERMKAEGAIANSEKRFRALIENGLDDISLLAPDGTLLWESPSAIRNLGYPPESFMGHNIFELMHPDDLEWTQKLYQKLAQKSGSREQGAFRLQRADGSWRWVEAIATNMLNEPSVNAIVINYRDITERKQAEARINDLFSFNEKILNSSPLGILTYKVTGECVFANEKAASIVGTNIETLRLQNFHAIEAWKKSGLYALIEKAISTKTAMTDDIHVISTFGKDIWMNAHCVTFVSNEEEHVLLSISDITERVITETALKESTAQLRTLFEASPDGIMLIDPRGDWPIVDCNSTAATMNGYTREELIGKPIDILNLEGATPDSRLAYLKRIQDAEVLRYETVHFRKDGTSFPIEISTTLIQLGERDMVLGIDRDITERKRTEAAEREQRILAEALRDTAQILSSSLEYGEVLDHILTTVGRVVPHDAATIMLIEGEFAQVVRLQGYEQRDTNREITGIKLPLAETTNLRKMFETKQPEVIYDTHSYTGWKRIAATDWLCSNVGAPISIYGKVIGFILLDSQTPRFFTPIHAERLGTFANQAALAIHNAHLLQQAQEEIAERKRAEEELRQSENRYRTVVENQTELIVRWRPDGIRTFVNEAYCRYYGITTEQALNTNFMPLIYEEDRQQIEEKVSRLLSGISRAETDMHRVLKADGSIGWNEWTDHAIYDENDQLIEFQSVGRDITERKQAEQELRASEERFIQLANNIEEVFWMTDAQTGKEIYISPAGEKIWGHSLDYLMHEPDAFTEIILPEDKPNVLRALEKERHGEKVEIEYRIQHPDGSVHWVWDRAFPLFDKNGAVKTLAGVATDITDRKLAEMTLQQSQARYYDLFESSPIPLWEEDYSLVKKRIESLQQSGVTNLEEYLSAHPKVILELASLVKIIDVNQASIELYHARQKEDLIKNLLDFVSEETLQHFQEEILGLMSPAARFTWEGSDKTLDSKELIVVVNGSIPPGYEENWSKVIISINDITERKRTEEALRQSEERFGSAFEFAPIGIALVSIEGQWVKVNQALCELLGYTEQELITKTFQEITYPEDLDTDLRYVAQMLSGEIASYQMEKRYFHKSGNIVWVLLSVSLVKDGQGKSRYFISQIQDITERIRAEKEIYRRAQESAALLETSLVLTNLDLKVILQSVGNSAKALFTADGCRIFLMQPDGETLRCVLALQENFAAFSDLRVKLGEGVTGAVAASGRAEIVNEMQNDPRAVQVPGTQDQEEESIMFAPLKERDRTIGVLSIRRAGAERPFQPADLELLEAFASMAASAVSNARLFEEAQQRLSELEALYENGLAVGQLLKPRKIGERMIETFARYLSWHHVTIRLLRPETDELELIAFNLPGLNDDQKMEMEHHFNKMIQRTGQGLSGEAVRSGAPLRTGNVRLYSQYVDTQAGIESGLYMPLKIGDQIIGVISVESETPDAFSEQDERLLATLANQAAIAFENARLYQAAHEEILERTRAQAALWASETHYRELADSITDILFEMDHNLCYTHWNKASEMFSGVPAEDAIGKPIQDLFETSEEQSKREAIYRSVLTERQARTFETEIFSKGEKRVLEINAYPSTRGVSVVARDITERKLDETLMQKRFGLMEYSAHHSLEELMQKTIDEISLLTESHIGFLHFVEEDQESLSLQAWSSETTHGMGKIEEQGMHYPIDSAGVWADAVRQRRALIHNDYESLPNKKMLPENHVKVIREMVIPIIRDEKIVATLGVGNKTDVYVQHDIEIAERFADYAWDITERKQMESALADERNQLAKRVEDRTADLSRANSNLARALRVKDEFLANMSHELRTPLNAILGLSESLSEQIAGPLNEKQQKYLNTINESGHHLLSLINDILDLAKIEAGQITLDINKVDVNSVCQASVRMIKQLAQKKNQEVIFEIDGDVGLMWADERRLKQMIVNLLSNAVKFTPEAGKFGLEVHGDQAGNRVLITVWDKGIGISDRDMERLFKPFVQLDSGLAREASGTGLGLALVAQMARLHGGSVNVESQVGGGSRFTIQLPWEPALAADTVTRLRSTGKFRAIDIHATNKPTILLIEDTLEVVMMLVDYLEMTGFKIVTAQDGVEGLEQAKLTHPDLILMDIQMPRMDGFEATQKLRMDPEFKDTPIIALTALAMPNDRQRCLEAGMDEYISKPVNLKALVKLIRSILLGKEGKPT